MINKEVVIEALTAVGLAAVVVAAFWVVYIFELG